MGDGGHDGGHDGDGRDGVHDDAHDGQNEGRDLSECHEICRLIGHIPCEYNRTDGQHVKRLDITGACRLVAGPEEHSALESR